MNVSQQNTKADEGVNAELEAAADELLAKDIREHSFDGTILLSHHLRRRREREVYSPTGLPEGFEPGIFSRPCSGIEKRVVRREYVE